TIGWSLVAGAVGAGVAWGAMRGSISSAHKRITEAETRIVGEKNDREKSVAELKADMIRGFGEIKTDLREQTRTVLEAIDRGPR
ncbi:MAG: hypothetical protein Q8K82_13555, partial [Gemmatimonadaceae bacterium]|nr:hypothetical protein [Gemmatimonadaceae bacterium]